MKSAEILQTQVDILVQLIKQLETRIDKLERLRDQKMNQGDTWYWEHG